VALRAEDQEGRSVDEQGVTAVLVRNFGNWFWLVLGSRGGEARARKNGEKTAGREQAAGGVP
jgi:hypothetical protein